MANLQFGRQKRRGFAYPQLSPKDVGKQDYNKMSTQGGSNRPMVLGGSLVKSQKKEHCIDSMNYAKVLRDWLFKAYLQHHKLAPEGLVELQKYFRNYPVINFKNHLEDGMIVAVSDNFRYGSIVTFAKNKEELDEKIKDAILTSFGIPSSYAKEAGLRREGAEHSVAYAAA